MVEEVKSLLNQYHKITILTHLNPDADTLGTALGIYGILKISGKQVEVANYGTNLPIHLDFLPHFSKIKNRIDFNNSLIISCDTGSIDRLGFDLSNRKILNIDHHRSNTNYGTVNVVEPTFVSASHVAYALFKEEYVISKDVATCFYTALVSDTQYFTTNNVSKDTFNVASELIDYGINISEVVSNIKQRRSLASIRILSSTLDTLDLYEDGQLVFMFASKGKMLEAGANILDLVGVVEYGISLVTAQISIVLAELEDVLRVSIRSKQVDVSALATTFGGGGHKYAAGFEIKNITKEALLEMIKKEIKQRGLLDEK